jgi:hypothetical protein
MFDACQIPENSRIYLQIQVYTWADRIRSMNAGGKAQIFVGRICVQIASPQLPFLVLT